ncbi:site-specific DNA-methyltransferase [Lactobacillus delbrueckii subsp. lactis]|nr:site-specific DNA-methyltransferase [Lactobacillus delbrueckii]MBO1149373.1 site-specific DNA-methyltransferase [Streptococcus thermophilus]MBO1193252.1 site-specific DNA-methyltransferase [Lactobacillus delbrueckii subsp. lactis]MCD5527672.1 site-specific DNA-methyltransferase [Lactobacillus delbrueckii subsp. lactis]MCD5541087.1 site-specific DNA-methyltransferase [Lactobacillus delbrueckii subsp. lactis]MCD5545028.1 site-specific DNA-methyltransferase [Lactobacillus delbrueckii subsp. la
MDKLKMHTPDIAEQNYKKLAALFPDAITETTDEDGNIIRAIDKDVLMQEINTKVIDDGQERYQFTWPDKRKSMVMANTPISKTLRLEKEKSVGRDGTPGGVDSENIYIEGDNLDALKLLQETYLGKVKMIYIDPPYNTGNDFIYEDDFAQSSDEYADNSGQTDEEGNRLVQNSESNGRFHTDWLNMIYPRLRLARDFLTDDGVIFISIDENEVQNLRKVCDEIFGEANFVSQLGWQKVYSPKNQAKYFSNDYEYVLCYAKKIENFKLNDLPRTEEMNARYKNPDNDPRGDWKPGDCIGNGERKNGNYTVISPITGKAFTVPQGKHWVYAPKKMEQLIKDNRIYFGKDGNSIPSVKQFLSEMGGRKASSLLMYDDYGHTDMAKKDLKKLFPELEKIPFPTPKPVKLVKTLAKLGTNKGDVIMDFFAGSATSAQSILDLNSEMHMHRKFILVQSGEEKIEKNQKAELLGIKTISDLAQVRIRRAGKKIKEETAADIDYGFRFFKVDSSNMKDVYHAPADVEQLSLDCFEDNIKEDRTPEDLLIQVMLDLGILLSSDIETQEIAGKKVFSVADDYLLACFDKDVTEETVIEIAKKKPFYAVFRDNSMANDSVAANFEQIFETYSPETVRKVL